MTQSLARQNAFSTLYGKAGKSAVTTTFTRCYSARSWRLANATISLIPAQLASSSGHSHCDSGYPNLYLSSWNIRRTPWRTSLPHYFTRPTSHVTFVPFRILHTVDRSSPRVEQSSDRTQRVRAPELDSESFLRSNLPPLAQASGRPDMVHSIRPQGDVDGSIPLVIVQGFLGPSGAWIWGNFESHLNRGLDKRNWRRTIFVSIGPVSSLHDRACELYYALVGGTVDYGEEHSAMHRHARYGRKILQGDYPEWSSERPLHFLGHSMGGPTIIKLQWLLKQGHFGPRAHPRMVLSVSAISAPFRGTQSVYVLGMRADAAPAVRPFSVGFTIGKSVHLLSFLSPLLPQAFDLHGDSRSLTYRDISFSSLLKQLLNKSDWAEGRDNAAFDVTFLAADEREIQGEGDLEPKTYYQSYSVCMTHRYSENSRTHTPSMRHITSPILCSLARMTGAFDFSTLQPPPSFLRQQNTESGARAIDSESILGEEHWANDGVVPVFSQWHPLPCCRTRCQHFARASQATVAKSNDVHHLSPQPGIWYVNQEEDAHHHHMSIVPWWTGSDRQQRFWVELGRWLDAIEENQQDCEG